MPGTSIRHAAICLALAIGLSSCADNRDHTPAGASPQASTGLTHPAVYCDHILIGGDLAANVAGLNRPSSCERRSENEALAATQLDAHGWVGEVLPAPDNAFARELILNVAFCDRPLTFGILPRTDPDRHPMADFHHVLPPLETTLSSSVTRIEEVTTIDQGSDTWICVAANKAVILDRMLNINLCRPVGTAPSQEAIAALARAIVRDDLSQIDAKE